jgi:REP element-mobilizing transposase RayT
MEGMPRTPRIHLEGAINHVWARGNRRQLLFRSDRDYRFCLHLLDEVARRRNWCCLSYCLMPNHFHLVTETSPGTLAPGMRDLTSRYAGWFNEVNETGGGHVFQGRYGSKPVTNDLQLAQLFRYVAANPVRAGLCEQPAEWPWSAYRALSQGRGGLVHPQRVEALLEPWGGSPGSRYARLLDPAQSPLAYLDPAVSPWEVRPTLDELFSDSDESAAIRRARDCGYRLREIAAQLGVSEATVSRRCCKNGV